MESTLITKRNFLGWVGVLISGVFKPFGFSQQGPGVVRTIHGVEILKRSGWGASPPNWDRLKPRWRGDNVKYVTIHHTATPLTDKLPPLKSIKSNQNYHMNDKGWGDVAYHYMVTPDGKVYEARSPKYGSDSHGPYLTKEQWESAKSSANGVTLFPFADHDIESPGASNEHINIAFVGDYYKAPPTAAAIATVEALTVALLKEYNLGADKVCFHREIGSTECPGDHIYRHFRGEKMKRTDEGPGMKKIRESRGA